MPTGVLTGPDRERRHGESGHGVNTELDLEGDTTPRPPSVSRWEAAARHWWDAVSGGRFFTVWTLVTSAVVAVAILSPSGGLVEFPDLFAAAVASLMSWGLLVLLVLPLAFVERRLSTRAARGTLVIGVLVAGSIGRPFLNDALAGIVFGHASDGGWTQRVATNALVWLTLLPLVAAVAAWYADSRSSAARLAAAAAVFDDLRQRISRYQQANDTLLADAIAHLRSGRDALLAAPVDFDSVRAFADDVRAASHRLDERLQTPLDHRAGYALPTTREGATPSAPFGRLARPPALLLAAVYCVASAPFTFAVGGFPLLIAAIAAMITLSLAADVGIRVFARGRTPTTRGLVIVTCWILVGAGMTVAGMLLTSVDGLVLLVPLISIPGIAVVAAFGADALERTRGDTATLTRLLETTSTIAATQTARAREPLWRAVDLLHDRVQSRCVIFAARADEAPPTTADAERFRVETDAAFDEILVGVTQGAGQSDDLDGLLATWSGVLELRAEIDAGATAALQIPAVVSAVAAAVSEGLVNAVKHSAARAARLRVAEHADGTALIVTVASAGTLRASGVSGLGIASFDGRAQLRQEGEDVVLEVVVPLVDSATSVPERGTARRWQPPTVPIRLPSRR